MYPKIEYQAKPEDNIEAVKEFNEQGRESNEHAQQFRNVLALAEKRFAALKKVEERHATAYQKMLQEVQ
jgi:rubrerythrin